MAAPVGVNCPYERAERRLLDIVSVMGGQKFRFLHRSQSLDGLQNGGTVCEWVVGIEGGLVLMLM